MTEPSNVNERLLCVALALSDSGKPQFVAEQLVVSAWEHYPNEFGLDGWTHTHPDSNRVLSPLMGERGLVKRGWFRRVCDKTYELTEAGRREAMRFQSGQVGQTPKLRRVTLDIDDAVWLEGTFRLSLTAASSWCFAKRFLRDRPSDSAAALFRLRDRLRDGEAVLPGGRSVTRADVEGLIQLHERLCVQCGKAKVKS